MAPFFWAISSITWSLIRAIDKPAGSGQTGHLGPTIFRSYDMGKSWSEATPTCLSQGRNRRGAAFGRPHLLADPGHVSEPGVWYAGTSPQALFRSEDGGQTWDGVSGFNDHPDYRSRSGGAQDGTPDGAKLHSIIVDPRDPAHLYLGMSGGGVHETRDRGESWTPLIDGMDVVAGFDAGQWAFHDPHCLALCPSNPDRIYQQNHYGIYRIDRPSPKWQRIGRAMPDDIGDIGFPITVHPRDDQTAWVFPMDGTDVWPAPALRAAPPPMSRVMAAIAGKGKAAACHRTMHGGPSIVRPWPMTPVTASASISAHPAAAYG
jgi:hypothetical protein